MSSVKNQRELKWLDQIKEAQTDTEPRGLGLSQLCIFTIPEPLRFERPEAYVPQVVSLGPYHHLKDDLYESERYKSRLTARFEIRANMGGFQSLVNELIRNAVNVRNCYSQRIEPCDEVLGRMMARDALFLVEFIGCSHCLVEPVAQPSSWDAAFHPDRKSPLFFPLQADIFKLENQIPLFILKKVLAWENCSETEALEKLKAACRQFSPFLPIGDSDDPAVRPTGYDVANDEVHLLEFRDDVASARDERHLLELLYNSLMPSFSKGNLSNNDETTVSVPYQHEGIVHRFVSFFLRVFCSSKTSQKAEANLPSASDLHRRGVKFTAFAWASGRIKFDKASSTLFLPKIQMDYKTDVFLRNLIAWEAYMTCTPRVFTCYVDLMDRLIDTPSDVAVLKKYGIIYSDLGSDKEVSNLWNGIRRSIWKSAYQPIDQTIKDVNAYYKSRCRVMFGEFMQENFSKPWRALSVVGACILLLLEVLQTIFSYIQLRSTCTCRR